MDRYRCAYYIQPCIKFRLRWSTRVYTWDSDTRVIIIPAAHARISYTPWVQILTCVLNTLDDERGYVANDVQTIVALQLDYLTDDLTGKFVARRALL